MRTAAAYRIVTGGADEGLKELYDGLVRLSVVERKTCDCDAQHWVEAVTTQERDSAALHKPTHRVVISEISGGKFPVISGNLFQSFRKFPEIC